ncbi:MAG TPA: glycine betaine ABC transporter substrate-binding protein [Acidimicrobiales bacterium]|nr:glycine betaine ABC transporter substrate-binding protein [Acidimicrobiales bacterium]
MGAPDSATISGTGPPTGPRRARALVGLAVLALASAACGGAGATSSTTSSSATPPSAATGSTTGGGATTAAKVALPPGKPGANKPPITMGDKNFSEEYLLGDLYQQALQAKGYKVTLKSNIGSSEIIDKAFSSHKIELYPEYTGEIVSTIAKKKQKPSAAGTWHQAKTFEAAHRNATVLPQTPFEDINVILVKPAFAKKYHLASIGDLNHVGPHGKGVILGGPPSNRTRYEGLVGMQKAYGLTGVKYKGLPIGVYYNALNSGSLNAAMALSTDAELGTGSYHILKDPHHIMGFQHVVPVVSNAAIKKEGPAFTQTLNWVDSLLSLKAIRAMNAAVQLHHANPATVAKKFLAANGVS